MIEERRKGPIHTVRGLDISWAESGCRAAGDHGAPPWDTAPFCPGPGHYRAPPLKPVHPKRMCRITHRRLRHRGSVLTAQVRNLKHPFSWLSPVRSQRKASPHLLPYIFKTKSDRIWMSWSLWAVALSALKVDTVWGVWGDVGSESIWMRHIN